MTVASILQRLRAVPPVRWAEHAIALVASALFALSFGLNYGVDNQVSYLLKSLALVTPDILQRDWYTYGTTHYHAVFEYLAALLIIMSREGWMIAYAQLAVITSGMFIVWLLVKALAPRRVALAAFLAVLALAFQTRTSSVAVSYIFDFILQPSTLGSLGLIAAMWLFVEGRWLASGIALGLGGAFHANYLVLGIASFGLAQLTLGKDDVVKRVLKQVGPGLIVFVLLLPVFLATASDPNAQEAQNILFKVRSPHHYNPAGFEDNFVPLAGLQAIALGAAYRFFGRQERFRRAGALLCGLMVLVWAGTFLTTRFYEPHVVQIFVWRFAPFLDLFCQLLACVALFVFVSQPFIRRWPVLPLPLLIMAGVTLIAIYRPGKENRYSNLLLAGALVALVVFLASLALRHFRLLKVMRTWTRSAPVVCAAVATAVAFWSGTPSVKSYAERSNLLNDESKPTRELYEWMRTSSPKDAIFLTPPRLEGFRFHGQRAIVVDWKATPIVPTELVEWRRRLSDVVGRQVNNARDLAGYDSMDDARLARLREKYGVTHVVTTRGREKRLGGTVVYRNSGYSVVKP